MVMTRWSISGAFAGDVLPKRDHLAIILRREEGVGDCPLPGYEFALAGVLFGMFGLNMEWRTGSMSPWRLLWTWCTDECVRPCTLLADGRVLLELVTGGGAGGDGSAGGGVRAGDAAGFANADMRRDQKEDHDHARRYTKPFPTPSVPEGRRWSTRQS